MLADDLLQYFLLGMILQCLPDGEHISFDDSDNTPGDGAGTMLAHRFQHGYPSLQYHYSDAHI